MLRFPPEILLVVYLCSSFYIINQKPAIPRTGLQCIAK